MAFHTAINTDPDRLLSQRNRNNSKESVKVPNYGQLVLYISQQLYHSTYIGFGSQREV